ncbi:MBL fold metallo-hydrolase [Streptomyces sp. SAI-127]|uniref:MBL fold metallo-hydrolase n=1 Tax=Streptomyces sp. SAI-127 TaxID=2940543 RepID=UPI00247427D5|nr:MBL fold metallo-hydrolase [Streptomyces sp. SAI-127]MDH6484343.1 glyoxylase-like metal-dependent hydrolase (beta-lactamase superfamily II) [Streptomyces sp. SAI-127]
MSGSDWFQVSETGPGAFVIAEPGHVNSYLVLGDELALLYDTGMGVGDIGERVRRLTRLPLLVVNSHHHFDHRGGNASVAGYAADIAVHAAGAALHRDPAPREWLEAYTHIAHGLRKRYEEFRVLDVGGFFLTDSRVEVRPVPDLADWRIEAVRPTRLLCEGDVLDLGGRRLEALHTPGHSPDGVCLWEPETGLLLAGDTLISGTFFAHVPGADVTAFAASTRRLAELPVATALLGHNLRHRESADFVGRVAEAFAAVRDGRTRPYASTDMFGVPVRRHDFDGFAVLTAPYGTEH